MTVYQATGVSTGFDKQMLSQVPWDIAGALTLGQGLATSCASGRFRVFNAVGLAFPSAEI
jgi:hypothetical protein